MSVHTLPPSVALPFPPPSYTASGRYRDSTGSVSLYDESQVLDTPERPHREVPQSSSTKSFSISNLDALSIHIPSRRASSVAVEFRVQLHKATTEISYLRQDLVALRLRLLLSSVLSASSASSHSSSSSSSSLARSLANFTTANSLGLSRRFLIPCGC